MLLHADFIAPLNVLRCHHGLAVCEVTVFCTEVFVCLDVFQYVIKVFFAVVDIPQDLIVKPQDPAPR
jgi:hypothetical protein